MDYHDLDLVLTSCSGGQIDAGFYSSVVRSRNLFAEIHNVTSSPRIAPTRNIMVETFLKTKHNWLLMVDSDMVFSPQDVIDLVETAVEKNFPILGGLYFGGQPGGKVTPHVYRMAEDEDGVQVMQVIEGTTGAGVWGQVVQCHATGAGFLLMSRAALVRIGEEYKDLAHKWFAESGTTSEYGEDVTFCLRAVGLGMPIHVHTGVILGHLKTAVLDHHSHAAYLVDRETVGDEEVLRSQMDRLKIQSAIISTPGADTVSHRSE